MSHGLLQLAAGSLVDNRFEINRAAGSGAMGVVYRAHDRHTGGWVALKLLHPDGAGAFDVDRFAREAQLLSELRHPGIVSYVASGLTSSNQRFLAMEWLDGQELTQHLVGGPLALTDCLVLLGRVTDALAVAHRHGIIHRDLKPSNLFLPGGEFAQAKLLDFGIARRGSDVSPMTQTGTIIGTPEYMAPEQARGERHITPAVDLFSLGCVLYECLTGHPPFSSEHIAAVLVRILFEEPDPIEGLRTGVPAPLIALTGRLLAKNPAQRPADASALQKELAQLPEMRDEGPEPARHAVAPRPRRATFADSDQELLSLILAAPLEDSADPDLTLYPTHFQIPESGRRALMEAVRPLKVTVNFLTDGTLLATVAPMDSVHDQVAQAARAALLIQEIWPAFIVVMATGRGSLQGRTAIGEVVEQAARLLSAGSRATVGSDKGGVILDALSSRLLQGRFVQTVRAGSQVLVAETQSPDDSRLVLGKPTPCLGRDRELGILDGVFCGCREDSVGRLVLITGPTGIGKSRIRHEFVRRLKDRHESCEIIFGRGDPLSADAAYGLIGQAVRRYCEIGDNELPVEQQRKLRERLAAVVAPSILCRVTAFIGELCAIPYPDNLTPLLSSARQNPRVMNQQVQQAAEDWLRAECERKPIVLILEDLHWSDQLTVQLIGAVMRNVQNLPLMVFCTARPEISEAFPGLWVERGVLDLHLAGLSSKVCDRLIHHMLGSQVDAATRQRLVSQSAGNPLFLEELIRAVAEGNHDSLPDTALAMLQARQRRLGVTARRVLRAASVFGESFWPSGIAEILGEGISLADVERWLEVLRDAEMIQLEKESRFINEPEYRFQHSLLRAAAYAMLSEVDCQLAHQAAGLYVERQGESSAAVLAGHAHKGGQPERAAVFYVKAAQHASDNSDLEGSFKLAEQAVDCGAAGELLGNARRIQAVARLWQNQFPRAAEIGTMALAHLPFGSALWVKTIAVPIFAFINVGQRQQAIALLDQLTAFTPPEPLQRDYLFAVRMTLAAICQRLGTRAAEPLVRHVERVLPEPLLRQLHATQYDYYRNSELDPWKQIKLSEDIVAGLAESGMTRESGLAVAYIGEAYGEAGLLAHGEARLRAALERNTEPYGHTMFLIHLAALLLIRADEPAQDEVRQICQKLLANPSMSSGYVGWCHLLLAQVHLLRDELAAAHQQVSKAVEILGTAPCRRLVARAVLIEVLVRQVRTAEALASVAVALAEVEELGKVGYAEIPIHTAASLAYRQAGQLSLGKASLERALRELHRRAELAPNEEARERFLTQIPGNVRVQELGRTWLAGQAQAAPALDAETPETPETPETAE